MNKGGLYSFSDGIEIASGENVGTAFWMIPPPVTVPPIFPFTAHRVLWQEGFFLDTDERGLQGYLNQ
jgi:hypothetical protein